MKKNGAALIVYALEQIGVRKTFGIPGISNSTIYEALYKSAHIEPIIVSSELSAGYMADAVSRTTTSIGTIIVVQGAGITHAMSAIAQANIDGIPLLIISGSNRIPGKDYHLHYMDLSKALDGIAKNKYQINDADEIISTIYEAFELAVSGEPGPVFIEIPLSVQMEQTESQFIPFIKKGKDALTHQGSAKNDGFQLFAETETLENKLENATEIIRNALSPGIYAGWGAIGAVNELKQLAELLTVPVSTTLQGISVFPYDHSLHAGMGFGHFAVPAAQNAFKKCDCLIAVGAKFSELATANYQLPVPENLIHIDINPSVFHKNYHAKVAIEGDSQMVLKEIIQILIKKNIRSKNDLKQLSASIENDKAAYKKSWLRNPNEVAVSPGFFFNALRNHLPKDTYIVTGGGNHRFLAAELFPISEPRLFIGNTDSNCMGYGLPAAIGVKLMYRSNTVIAIIGEAGLLTNGLELITAHYYKLGLIVFVLRESGILYSDQMDNIKNFRKTETAFKSIDLEKYAASIQAEYLVMKNDIDISGVITKSKEFSKIGKNVIVEVHWDSSRKSMFAEGLTKPDMSRHSILEKLKMLFKSNN